MIDASLHGITFAGHQTRWKALTASIAEESSVRASVHPISGWVDGGAIERLPLPRSVRGRLRSTLEARYFATTRADVIWTSAAQAIQPWLFRQLGPFRRPLILDLDWTLAQQEAMAPVYFNRSPRDGIAYRQARLRERAVWKATSLFTPWSNWAADSLRVQGVDPAKIRVIPPGLDLSLWSMPARSAGTEAPLRLLFVGNDFRRKGGDLVLDVVHRRSDFELDVVSGDPSLQPSDRVRIHRATPNSPELRDLYARADLFVMPSRAECFGIAYLEALASGLPVVAGNSGGVRDIVAHGEWGWVVDADPHSLANVLDAALYSRATLADRGRAGRAHVEREFDGAKNVKCLVDEMIALVEKERLR